MLSQLLAPLGALCLVWIAITDVAYAVSITSYTLDFETEDDFSTPLINGQSIYSTPRPDRVAAPAIAYSNDAVLEFGNLVSISSTVIGNGTGHLGPVIFDSNMASSGTQDDDLLVGLGNLLILHRNEGPNHDFDPTYGLVFRNPNDEADFMDRGSIVFDFLVPLVRPISIDLVDVDNNVQLVVILTDKLGFNRTYLVPANWTTDINANPAGQGYRTLDLQTLFAQTAEPLATGGPATASEEFGYGGSRVARLEVQFVGLSPSGALDNLIFQVVPEPSTTLLSIAGMGCIMFRSRRIQHTVSVSSCTTMIPCKVRNPTLHYQ